MRKIVTDIDGVEAFNVSNHAHGPINYGPTDLFQESQEPEFFLEVERHSDKNEIGKRVATLRVKANLKGRVSPVPVISITVSGHAAVEISDALEM